MISCANSSCSRKLRYLHQGKLFVLPGADHKKNPFDESGRMAYAWLCDECASKFEVFLDTSNHIALRPLTNSPNTPGRSPGMFR